MTRSYMKEITPQLGATDTINRPDTTAQPDPKCARPELPAMSSPLSKLLLRSSQSLCATSKTRSQRPDDEASTPASSRQSTSSPQGPSAPELGAANRSAAHDEVIQGLRVLLTEGTPAVLVQPVSLQAVGCLKS
jgi:hypothetical protein